MFLGKIRKENFEENFLNKLEKKVKQKLLMTKIMNLF
jgi:hypothetical protein